MNRRSLLILCLVVAVDTGSFGLLAPVLPFLVADLTGSLNAITVTQVSALYAGCQLIGAPLIGRLSDRWGRKPLMIGAVSIGSLALLGSGLSGTLGLLMLFQAIKGGTAAIFALAQAMVADRNEDSNARTVSFGALGAALGLGFVFGPALGGLIGSYSPRAAFFVAAALTLINLLLVLFVLPETLTPQAGLDQKPEPLRWWTGAHGKLRQMLAIYFLFYLGFSSFTSIFVVDVSRRFGWGPQASGLLLCFVGVIVVLVQGGILPKLLLKYRAKDLAEAGLLLVGIALLGVSAIKQGSYLYLTQLVFATGVGLSTPGLRTLLSTAVNERQQGILGGLTQSCVSLTSLLGPLAAGQIYTYSGFRLTFQLQAAVVFLAAALLIMSRFRSQSTNTPSA
ncbi:MFS transporter [Cyanobium sp. T1G-Tous]|uniref:MFS transporter n=1 Tax=Cyanobium sp. T1G-Tous TaxID=2823722 RepID=UPI0020CFC47C|nr:MFS transporter [Cyanobium sp. T1G-Tous]MCP9803044.1 MFS transporter [Cyanobium sp. T1G-Tous]